MIVKNLNRNYIFIIILMLFSLTTKAQWEKLKIPAEKVNCFAIDSTTIYVGTNNGIFISTDNGDSWQSKSGDLEKTDVDTNLFFIIQKNYPDFNINISKTNINSISILGNNVYLATNNGAYISTDNCNTWNEIKQDSIYNTYTIAEKDYTANKPKDIIILKLKQVQSVVQLNENLLLLKYNDNKGFSWFYTIENDTIDTPIKTRDRASGIFLLNKNTNSYTKIQSFGDITSAINKNDTIIISTSELGIFYSVNEGNSWVSANKGITYKDSTKSKGVSLLQIVGNEILAKTDNGYFVSRDNSLSWKSSERLNGFNNYKYFKTTVYNTNLFALHEQQHLLFFGENYYKEIYTGEIIPKNITSFTMNKKYIFVETYSDLRGKIVNSLWRYPFSK